MATFSASGTSSAASGIGTTFAISNGVPTPAPAGSVTVEVVASAMLLKTYSPAEAPDFVGCDAPGRPVRFSVSGIVPTLRCTRTVAAVPSFSKASATPGVIVIDISDASVSASLATPPEALPVLVDCVGSLPSLPSAQSERPSLSRSWSLTSSL